MSFRCAVSGQHLYFVLQGIYSGNVVTGASGAISGRKSIDGGSQQSLISGFITEIAGGQYVANLYDWDLSGRIVGFLFTASGCAAVNYTITTDLNQSGRTYLASGSLVGLLSGQSVQVYSGQLSGQPLSLISGLSYPASGVSTVTTVSGQTVVIASGNLSGQLVTAASGVFGIASLNSGQLVNVNSGNLNSGQIIPALSGQFVIASLNSGQTVLVASGNLNSGQIVSMFSGQSVIASLYSGNLNSGQIVQAYSGVFGTASLNSGQSVLVYSGQLSGQVVNLLSGNQVGVWSGTNVNIFSGSLSRQLVTAASCVFGTASLNSGQLVNLNSGNLNSGQTVQAYSGLFGTTSLNSGQTVLVASGNLNSGQIVQVASGVFGMASLNSGQLVNVNSGNLSGQPITLLSGLSFVASGISTVTTVSGQTVVVASGNLSGQLITLLSGLSYTASGIFATTPATASGLSVIASLNSGQIVLVASGNLNSGQIVQVYSGINAIIGSGFPSSGYPANFANLLIGSSGQVWANSGQVIALAISDKSGYSLAPTGLDLISGDNGNLRQMVNIAAAILAGKVSGANTGTELFAGLDGSSQRAVVTVDSSGNRTGVLYSGG